jgi:predicted glycosyl hydrolase (DUF1957 family)
MEEMIMGMIPVVGPFNEKAYIKDKMKRWLQKQMDDLGRAEARDDVAEQERIWRLIRDSEDHRVSRG